MPVRTSVLTGLLLAGCALLPPAAHADLRIQERASSLDSTVTRWIAIKGEKRAIVTRAEVSGTLYNAGAKYGAYVEIARPDKELIWELDPQERSYRAIPAAQFSKLLQKGVQAPRNPNDQPLRSLYRTDAATTAIEVVPTGKTKRIAGYPAEEVMARVIVGVQNLVSGNKFTFTFDQQIWITKDEQLMKEIRGFEEAYVEQFGSAASLSQAQVLAGSWNDAFITHLRSVNDRIRALGGYPLSVTTTVTEEAVAQTKGEKGSSRRLDVGTTEVVKISTESIPDAEFELPAGYIDQDTKVAVAPTPGNEMPAVATNTTPPPPVTMVAKNDVPAVAPMVSPAPVPTSVSKEPAGPGVVASTPGNTAPAEAPVPGSTRPTTVAAAPPQEKVSPVAEKQPSGVPDRVAAARPTAERPQVPVVNAAPTNVVVSGGPGRAATESPSRPEKGREKVTPVLVTADQARTQGSFQVVPSFYYTTTPTAPSAVTVDEPAYLTEGKKPKKEKKKK